MTEFDTASIEGLILDMDGVIWLSGQPIGDLPSIFSDINRKGWRVILATNNSTLSVEAFLEKVAGLGVHLERWQLLNSAQAAAHFLRKQFPKGGPVFMIGETGLQQALYEKDFYHDEEKPQAVVVGMDRNVCFQQLSQASLLIRTGLPFIATNPDRTFPTPQGLMPGAGAIMAFIETATDIKPIVVGKPTPEMYKVALERLGTPPEKTLIVGDRIETDIVGGQALGCRTALVLSGVTTETAAYAWRPAPDIIALDLASLLELFGSLD
jgi:4-nitrophenyl phosphatase